MQTSRITVLTTPGRRAASEAHAARLGADTGAKVGEVDPRLVRVETLIAVAQSREGADIRQLRIAG
ncbi:MAG: hypothetical protein RQ833_02345 [Sphingomonadaceae bacterium]|nr:hypothetical protein [Sphingomonadaceae bacterium]